MKPTAFSIDRAPARPGPSVIAALCRFEPLVATWRSYATRPARLAVCWALGDDAGLMAHITWANVTAGFHGGDAIELGRSVDNSVA